MADFVELLKRYREKKEREQMPEGHIPVDVGDIPVSTPALDDSEVYTVELKRVMVNPKPDKSGNPFMKIQTEVVEGDFEGATLMCQWITLPMAIHEEMSKAEKFRAAKRSEKFGRFARSFKLKGHVPDDINIDDAESVETWQNWLNQFCDVNRGKVTIQNQVYPEGSGRLNSSINDFVF